MDKNNDVTPGFFRRMLMKMATAGTSYSLTDAALGKFFASSPGYAGKTVTEDSALKVSTAWACQRVLSETVGALPRAVYVKEGNNAKVSDHVLHTLFSSSPNADQTSVEFFEWGILDLCSDGNAYSLIERGTRGIVSLAPIHAADCEPFRDGDTVKFKVLDRGKYEVYPREKIWHVKGFGRGLRGLSPIRNACEALGMAMATEEFGAKYFSQGGLPSGIASTEKTFTVDQRKIARENLNQMVGGLGNAHKFALFEMGMKVEPWGQQALEDMQFIATRKFTIQEICRFYRIPPHMVADLDRATFSNIEQMSLEFVTFSLMPYFTRYEASMKKWLLKPEERDKYFLRFNYEGLLRADSAGRAAFYGAMLDKGVYNRNEVRALENMNKSPVAGMDDFFIQSAQAPIDKLGAMADATIARTSAPQPAFKAVDESVFPLLHGMH